MVSQRCEIGHGLKLWDCINGIGKIKDKKGKKKILRKCRRN